MPRFLALVCLLCFFPDAPFAIAGDTHGPGNVGYNRPDAPGTIQFDAVKLRVVNAPAKKIPQGCDATYRAGMEGTFRRVWEQCQAIGRSEPSDCQRALFIRCTRVANDLQEMEVKACIEMYEEKDALDSILKPDNQKNSQVSASDLNLRAAAASRRVATALEKSAGELAAQRQNAIAALNANACAFSTSAPQYKQTETKLLGELSQNESFVKAQADAKKAAADQFDRLGGRAATSASQLRSQVAVNPANTASVAASVAASGSTISGSTYTVTETVTAAPVSQTTTVTTSTVVTTTTAAPASPGYAYPPVTATPIPPYPDFSSKQKPIPTWVPILAIGVPAAILGGIMLSKMGKGGRSDPPDDSGGSTGGSGDPGGSSDPGSGTPNPQPVPGGADVRSLNLQLDSSFTDRQKATINEAAARIAPCYRYKLKNLEVRSASLSGRSARPGYCVAGTFTLGGNVVRLDPHCANGIQVGVTVHEFFHVLGNRNGNELHSRYKSKVASLSCPVSRYGATSFIEDFAEAGRIVTVPNNDRNSGSCVESKLTHMRQMLASCPQ